MWELATASSHRGFSLRSFFVMILAAIATAFFVTTVLPRTAHAADASWKSAEALTYNNTTYASFDSADGIKALGLNENDKVFAYIEPSGTSPRKIHILFFNANVDTSTATQTNYRTYTYNGPLSFSDPSPSALVTLAQTQADAGITDPDASSADTVSEGASSCEVDGGLGWIICPITNTLANWMDWAFEALSGFLVVRPLDLDQESALYRAWSYMRTFANIAFIVAFLIIIYSQITSIGLDRYGIKKLLPKIIIAAVLVNLSYIICALAIDLSNVIGANLQHIFIDLRNSLVGDEGNTWDTVSWESITSFILAGGGAAAAGGVALFTTLATYGVGGAILLLLPALVSGIFALLVALLVMAVRQALITILTVIAPLAFVAYLLPNTEEWFTKWRKLFMTMLILFPAFSLIFGGSQLASAIIIQNANSINVIILAMLVQVAPLVITPLLIKLSGTLISRIAGIVNNPNKGMIDRTRNWAKDRAENAKAQRLSSPTRPHEFMKRAGQRIDADRRRREGRRAAHTAMADAHWANTDSFSDIDQINRQAADIKSVGEGESELRYLKSKTTNAEIRQLDVAVRKIKLDTENAQLDASIQNWEKNHSSDTVTAKLHQRVYKDVESGLHKQHDQEYEELKSGVVSRNLSHADNIISYTALAREALVANKVATDATVGAQSEQQLHYANLLKDNANNIRQKAGGISKHGATRVLASAEATIESDLDTAIKNIQTTSSVKAGDIQNLRAQLDAAVATDDIASIVAYVNKLAASSNPGVKELREALRGYEDGGMLNTDTLTLAKQYINQNSTINAAAEDIGTWSRDINGRSLRQVAQDKATWSDMTPVAFASMKKSSQVEAFQVEGAVTRKRAEDILRNTTARGNLKPSIRKILEHIAAHGTPPDYVHTGNIPSDDEE